jgi:hypothetical protein
MNEEPLERFGSRVREVAGDFPYPPTPAPPRKEAVPHPAPGGLPLRRALAWVIVATLACLISVTAVPEARAGLVRMLRVGVIDLFFSGPAQSTASPSVLGSPSPAGASPTSSPAPTHAPPMSFDQWQGETTLDDARGEAGFKVLLPAYPDDLGLPDRVFLQDQGAPVVFLVWTTDGGRRIRLLLQELSPDSWGMKKLQLDQITTTTVQGNPAVWATGPYLLVSSNGSIRQERIVDGGALIWEQDGITLRLESSLPLEEARKIAESLR